MKTLDRLISYMEKREHIPMVKVNTNYLLKMLYKIKLEQDA